MTRAMVVTRRFETHVETQSQLSGSGVTIAQDEDATMLIAPLRSVDLHLLRAG
jgi:hypothetical protein